MYAQNDNTAPPWNECPRRVRGPSSGPNSSLAGFMVWDLSQHIPYRHLVPIFAGWCIGVLGALDHCP